MEKELRLVSVPFHGDVIEAAHNEQGVWASLRRLCESLGLDYSGQLQKLKTKPWARMEMISIHDSTGRKQAAACLHLDRLPMWLATIEASRVKEAVRPKLELYQKEAARVLAEHFLKSTAVPSGPQMAAQPASPLQALRLVVNTLEEQDRRLSAHDQRLFTVETQLERITATQEQATLELRSVERSPDAAPPLTVRNRLNQLVRAYCRATGAEHSEVWARLYKEMFYRCNFNAQLRAKHNGRKALDEVECNGLMPDLFAIASELLEF